MKAKWYFSTLILVILLGVVHQQFSAPNQEIVLQFSNQNLSSEQSQKTITKLKNQLLEIGVKHINVFEGINGNLKITYFTTVNASQIKQILLDDNILALNVNSQNERGSSKSSDTYDLDVFELHNSTNSQWDLEGTLVIELKANTDRFYSPKAYPTLSKKQISLQLQPFSLQVFKDTAIIDGNSSFNIPEVRAGPFI